MTAYSPSFRITLLAVLLLTLLSAQSVSGAGDSRGNEAVIDAAAEEAQGWPDYNPSDLATHVLKAEAAEEGAGWPNFDSTNLANQVRKVEQAKVEAAGWPNFDPRNITITVALAPVANGPHDAAY